MVRKEVAVAIGSILLVTFVGAACLSAGLFLGAKMLAENKTCNSEIYTFLDDIKQGDIEHAYRFSNSSRDFNDFEKDFVSLKNYLRVENESKEINSTDIINYRSNIHTNSSIHHITMDLKYDQSTGRCIFLNTSATKYSDTEIIKL